MANSVVETHSRAQDAILWFCPSFLRDGKNGQTFSFDASPDEYCDYIENIIVLKQVYVELTVSSFREYSERLNWASAGRSVYELMQEFCG